jgi:hypothetical protein
MQKPSAKSKSLAARNRKSGRMAVDKSGRGIWEWQTATGVFEQNITDDQLAQLENSQLSFIERPKEQGAVSYYEFHERSSSAVRPAAAQATQRGPLRRLFGRFSRGRGA